MSSSWGNNDCNSLLKEGIAFKIEGKEHFCVIKWFSDETIPTYVSSFVMEPFSHMLMVYTTQFNTIPRAKFSKGRTRGCILKTATRVIFPRKTHVFFGMICGQKKHLYLFLKLCPYMEYQPIQYRYWPWVWFYRSFLWSWPPQLKISAGDVRVCVTFSVSTANTMIL